MAWSTILLKNEVADRIPLTNLS